jgi:very-short-patch-repair endonuclease
MSSRTGETPLAKNYRLTPAQVLLGKHLKELLKTLGDWEIEYEYRFDPERRWRADIAIPAYRLLFECDGGQFHGGHKRGHALSADYERQNHAVLAGWRILRFTNQQVLSGEAKAFLKEYLGCKS